MNLLYHSFSVRYALPIFKRKGAGKTMRKTALQGKRRNADCSDIPITCRKFAAGMDIEFTVNIFYMRVEGFGGDEYGTGYFLIA